MSPAFHETALISSHSSVLLVSGLSMTCTLDRVCDSSHARTNWLGAPMQRDSRGLCLDLGVLDRVLGSDIDFDRGDRDVVVLGDGVALAGFVDEATLMVGFDLVVCFVGEPGFFLVGETLRSRG